MSYQGNLIVIEGGDAAGKKTQSGLLEKALESCCSVEVMSFPRYEGPFGDVILRFLHKDSVVYRRQPSEDEKSTYAYDQADDLVALRGLFALDQYEAAAEIKHLLSSGNTVILDRYWPSNVCYGVEDGFDMGNLLNISSSLPEADVYFYIDVSVEEATRRRPQARDRYERDKEKLARIRDRYLEMWRDQGRGSLTMLDNGTVFFSKPLWVTIDGHQETEKITEQMVSWVELLRRTPVRRDTPIMERNLAELGPTIAENLRNQIEERVKRRR
jgi:dTMP kinase